MATIVRRTFTVTLPDGSRVKKKCKHYSIRYTDAAGRRKWVKGYADRGATAQKAAKLDRAVARGEQEMVDRYAVHKARPLTAHLSDYIDHLRSLGRDPMYTYNAKTRLARLLAECDWSTTAAIDAAGFQRWRERRQKVGSKRGRCGHAGNGASPTTLNQWTATAQAFCNWLVGQNRMPSNPLARVPKVTGDTTRKRRALDDKQLAALVTAAPASRRLAWEFLLSTGLRIQEAVDLQWGDAHLESTKPYLRLRAPATKSRRVQIVPLRQDLAAQLRAVRPGDASLVAPVFPRFPTLEDWKADLAAAGIDYIDAAGRQADRHSLRTTLGTRLQKAGVPIRVAMELMRHSDIRLTTRVYTDPTAFDLTGAVESLPAVNATEPPTEKRVSVGGSVEGVLGENA